MEISREQCWLSESRRACGESLVYPLHATYTSLKMPPSQRRKQPIASPSPQSKRKAGAGSRSSTPSSKEPIPTQAAATDAPQGGSPAVHILLIFPLFTIIAALSLTTWLYGRALEPLYGSVPTNLHLDKVIWAASILGTLGPAPPLWTSVAVMGTFFCSLPNLAYWVPLWTARWHNPVFGPVATHLLVLFPVAYSGIAIVKNLVVSVYSLLKNVFNILPYLSL